MGLVGSLRLTHPAFSLGSAFVLGSYAMRYALCAMRFSKQCAMPGGHPRNMKMVLGLGSYAMRHAVCAMLFSN